MAKRKKDEAVAEAVAPIQELDTLPGETYGLAVTSPLPAPVEEPVTEPVTEPVETAEPEVDAADEGGSAQISADVAKAAVRDPGATVAAAVVALGLIYHDAGVVSAALSKHLRNTAGQPELHGFLHRMQALLGEYRHSFEQIDSGMSDELRDAVEDAIAA